MGLFIIATAEQNSIESTETCLHLQSKNWTRLFFLYYSQIISCYKCHLGQIRTKSMSCWFTKLVFGYIFFRMNPKSTWLVSIKGKAQKENSGWFLSDSGISLNPSGLVLSGRGLWMGECPQQEFTGFCLKIRFSQQTTEKKKKKKKSSNLNASWYGERSQIFVIELHQCINGLRQTTAGLERTAFVHLQQLTYQISKFPSRGSHNPSIVCSKKRM